MHSKAQDLEPLGIQSYVVRRWSFYKKLTWPNMTPKISSNKYQSEIPKLVYRDPSLEPGLFARENLLIIQLT